MSAMGKEWNSTSTACCFAMARTSDSYDGNRAPWRPRSSGSCRFTNTRTSAVIRPARLFRDSADSGVPGKQPPMIFSVSIHQVRAKGRFIGWVTVDALLSVTMQQERGLHRLCENSTTALSPEKPTSTDSIWRVLASGEGSDDPFFILQKQRFGVFTQSVQPGICLAPTGRCHTSPGHRPGLALAKHQSPEGAPHSPSAASPMDRPFRASGAIDAKTQGVALGWYGSAPLGLNRYEAGC